MGNMFFSSSGLISTPTGSIIACGDSLSGASENSSFFADLLYMFYFWQSQFSSILNLRFVFSTNCFVICLHICRYRYISHLLFTLQGSGLFISSDCSIFSLALLLVKYSTWIEVNSVLKYHFVFWKNCFSVPSLALCPKRVTDYRFMADYRFMTSSKLLHRYFHQFQPNADRFPDWSHTWSFQIWVIINISQAQKIYIWNNL